MAAAMSSPVLSEGGANPQPDLTTTPAGSNRSLLDDSAAEEGWSLYASFNDVYHIAKVPELVDQHVPALHPHLFPPHVDSRSGASTIPLAEFNDIMTKALVFPELKTHALLIGLQLCIAENVPSPRDLANRITNGVESSAREQKLDLQQFCKCFAYGCYYVLGRHEAAQPANDDSKAQLSNATGLPSDNMVERIRTATLDGLVKLKSYMDVRTRLHSIYPEAHPKASPLQPSPTQSDFYTPAGSPGEMEEFKTARATRSLIPIMQVYDETPGKTPNETPDTKLSERYSENTPTLSVSSDWLDGDDSNENLLSIEKSSRSIKQDASRFLNYCDTGLLEENAKRALVHSAQSSSMTYECSSSTKRRADGANLSGFTCQSESKPVAKSDVDDISVASSASTEAGMANDDASVSKALNNTEQSLSKKAMANSSSGEFESPVLKSTSVYDISGRGPSSNAVLSSNRKLAFSDSDSEGEEALEAGSCESSVYDGDVGDQSDDDTTLSWGTRNFFLEVLEDPKVRESIFQDEDRDDQKWAGYEEHDENMIEDYDSFEEGMQGLVDDDELDESPKPSFSSEITPESFEANVKQQAILPLPLVPTDALIENSAHDRIHSEKSEKKVRSVVPKALDSEVVLSGPPVSGGEACAGQKGVGEIVARQEVIEVLQELTRTCESLREEMQVRRRPGIFGYMSRIVECGVTGIVVVFLAGAILRLTLGAGTVEFSEVLV